MSGDIFMGLNEDSETEDEQQGIYGTPVEYSGVSGSGASSPTKSQQQQQPRPEPEPKPGPSSASQAQQEPPLQNGVYLCPAPNCKKSYKTLRGFYKHQLDKHPPEDIEMEPPPQPTDTPEVFRCTKCKSTFKTKQGLARHQAVHRYEEISGRKPQPADFKPFEMEVANKILREMLEEPMYGEISVPKKEFLSELLLKGNEWCQIVSELSEIVCMFICQRSNKILPMNQYEQAHLQLNKFLNNDETMSLWIKRFTGLTEPQVSPELVSRLIARFLFKLMNEVQSWVAQKMRSHEENLLVEKEITFSETQKKSFQVNLGNLFRGFFRKGLRSKSSQWHAQSASLKDTFINGQKPVSHLNYLNKNNWFSGEENSIEPSENAVDFFRNVEHHMQLSPDGHLPQTQEVIEKILVSIDSLNAWYYLTNNYMPEKDSIIFMREMILSYVHMSKTFEEQIRNRQEEKIVESSKVNLRQHFHRNYPTKDDESEALQ